MPKRIQRKRTKGWRMPENAVSITRPGRWGNPYSVSGYGDAALSMFETLVINALRQSPTWLEPLRGKDLACFCPEGAPCHGDVLLKFANRPHPVTAT